MRMRPRRSPYYFSPAALVDLVWNHLLILLLLSSASDHAVVVGIDGALIFDEPLRENCLFTPSGRAVECTEVNPLGGPIKYTIPCPPTATRPEHCLSDGRRICYQQHQQQNRPCLGSYYCATTKRFAVDCSNLFSEALGSACSKTDCRHGPPVHVTRSRQCLSQS
jgi:hypothetical protein